jgi:hypothetical protein
MWRVIENIIIFTIIMRSSMAPRSVRFGVRSQKLSNVGQSLDGWPKIYYLELLRASEGTLSRWFRLHLQSLPPINSHWARVVGYGPFSLCVIHKEVLWLSSGDINRLMMMIIIIEVKKWEKIISYGLSLKGPYKYVTRQRHFIGSMSN